jgi:hypothetical protein
VILEVDHLLALEAFLHHEVADLGQALRAHDAEELGLPELDLPRLQRVLQARPAGIRHRDSECRRRNQLGADRMGRDWSPV